MAETLPPGVVRRRERVPLIPSTRMHPRWS